MKVITDLKQELTAVQQQRLNAHQSKLQALQTKIDTLRAEENKYRPTEETSKNHIDCPATCDSCTKRTQATVTIGKLLKQMDELKNEQSSK